MDKALFTTKKDLSARFFKQSGWDIFFYESLVHLEDYRIVYFRDPFNDGTYLPDGESINHIIRHYNNTINIDNIHSFNQLVEIEDKYNQAKIYKDLMPKTFLPSQCEFVQGKYLAKKRLSRRAKDILFKIEFPLDDDWIYQELLDIKEELRVYVIFGHVVPVATIKTSKSANKKVKIIGGRELSDKETVLCEKIAVKSGLDFIGIDLAITKNNDYKLVEINRSPQFKRFVEIYGEEYLSKILMI